MRKALAFAAVIAMVTTSGAIAQIPTGYPDRVPATSDAHAQSPATSLTTNPAGVAAIGGFASLAVAQLFSTLSHQSFNAMSFLFM